MQANLGNNFDGAAMRITAYSCLGRKRVPNFCVKIYFAEGKTTFLSEARGEGQIKQLQIIWKR
jgi:hypothetical protein